MPNPTRSEPLLDELGAAVRSLRAALIELYAEVGADPAAPQEVSRRFGVTKSQAWKLSKVLRTADAIEAARHVPGQQGFRRILSALEVGGPSAEKLGRAVQAVDAFHQVVRTHATDRATFELTLDSMRAGSDGPAGLESNRRLAFLGNSATWGVQARLQVGLRVVVPSEDQPDLLSCANVTGLVDLRRLRADVRWPLAHYAVRYPQDRKPESFGFGPLDDDVTETGEAPLLRDFCSDPAPALRADVRGDNIRYGLTAGPVGKTAAITCLFGVRFWNFASSVATVPGEFAEHSALFKTPVETALIDLLLHRDLPFERPAASLYSRLDTDEPLTADRAARLRLPLAERVEPLGEGPPLLAAREYERQAELGAWVVDRLGFRLADFVGHRFVMRYPPIPTMLSLEHPLPEPGSAPR